MTQPPSKLERAIARIDDRNAEDPRTEPADGEPVPKELLYARRMTDWLERLAPDASEALRIAVRAQHLCRWKIPRDDYPLGRAGYKKWRTQLALMHADLAAEVLGEVGYDEQTIARVRDLVLKKRLGRDDEVQTLEDVACLVFLEHYFSELAAQHEDDKVVDILRKTWKKMSERGHEAALTIELPAREKGLVQRALSEPG